MTRCLIAIGSNQGNCRQNIQSAVSQIDLLPNTNVLLTSSLIQTAPVGIADQIFLNGALLVETELSAAAMMAHLLRIETAGGRDRERESGNRTIDLDILLFNEQVLSGLVGDPEFGEGKFDLQLPHPRMSFRRFVLEPAASIAPDMRHPLLDRTLGQLMQHIRESKNIVFVFVSSGLDLKMVEEAVRKSNGLSTSERDPEIDWLFTDNRLEWDAAVDQLPICDQATGNRWLVLATSQSRLLKEFVTTAKLLVTAGNAGSDDDYAVSLDRFHGPRWSLGDGPGEGLFECVLTAIESLEPIVPVESHDDG